MVLTWERGSYAALWWRRFFSFVAEMKVIIEAFPQLDTMEAPGHGYNRHKIL